MLSKILPGLKTHIVAILLVLVQLAHTQGYLTDKGASALSWILTAGMVSMLRLALGSTMQNIAQEVVTELAKPEVK